MRTLRPFLLDLLVVLAFVLIGRRSHDEGSALGGIVRTLWPFLTGLLLGWLVTAARVERSGSRERVNVCAVILWLCTVAAGMLLRWVSGQGVAFSFVIVATIFLGLGLLGWRLLASALRSRLTARRA